MADDDSTLYGYDADANVVFDFDAPPAPDATAQESPKEPTTTDVTPVNNASQDPRLKNLLNTALLTEPTLVALSAGVAESECQQPEHASESAPQQPDEVQTPHPTQDIEPSLFSDVSEPTGQPDQSDPPERGSVPEISQPRKVSEHAAGHRPDENLLDDVDEDAEIVRLSSQTHDFPIGTTAEIASAPESIISEGSDYDPLDGEAEESLSQPKPEEDFTTTVPTTSSTEQAVTVVTSVEVLSDDEEYDPTALDEIPSVTQTAAVSQPTDPNASLTSVPAPQTMSFPPVAPPPTTTSLSPALSAPYVGSLPALAATPAVDQTVLQTLAQRLLSDPTFVQLTDEQKQQRIAGEYIQLQSRLSNTHPAPPARHNRAPLPQQSFPQQSSRRQPHEGGKRATFHKPFEYDPRAPQRPDLNQPMSAAERQEYQRFIREEAQYDSKYPHKPNTRLFVGNIPTNHVGKEDLWRIFKVHGHVLQVSLKTAYGFIQYAEPDATLRAVAAEKVPLYDKEMVLEVAKNARVEEFSQGHDKGYRERDSSRKRKGDDDRSIGRATRGRKLEVKVLIQQHADPDFGRDVARQFQNHGFTTDYMFVRNGQKISDLVSDAAYSGVISAIMVSGNNSVDAQVYEETSDGSVRFDEYVALSVPDAIGLVTKAKTNRVPISSGGFGNVSPSSGFGNGGSDNGRHNGYSRRSRHDDRGLQSRGGRRGNFNERSRGGNNNNNNRSNDGGRNNRFNGNGNYSDHQSNSHNQRNNYNQSPSDLPPQLMNLTPEQFQELGARLGYQQSASAPVPNQNSNIAQQSAVQNLLASLGQSSTPTMSAAPPTANNVQSLLDSLSRMK